MDFEWVGLKARFKSKFIVLTLVGTTALYVTLWSAVNMLKKAEALGWWCLKERKRAFGKKRTFHLLSWKIAKGPWKGGKTEGWGEERKIGLNIFSYFSPKRRGERRNSWGQMLNVRTFCFRTPTAICAMSECYRCQYSCVQKTVVHRQRAF